MAEEIRETDLQEETFTDENLIDPIYREFVRGVTRAIGSTEFYEFFMDAISGADNEFQFSNRKVVKTIDSVWVDAIDGTLEAMQHIIASPRNIIKEEELIVNVANARKAGAETVRHLAQHSALVEDFNYDTGDVRPSKLMQRYREDTTGLYENRLVFTTMETAHHFVKIRYDALLAEMGDEFGAKLKIRSDMKSSAEHVHMDMYLSIKDIDSPLDVDEKSGDMFSRISRLNRVLTMLMDTTFAQKMAKLPRVKGTINKTNVLKRNKDYHQVMLLYEFLKSYDNVGYSINVIEQAPEISEQFEQDIYRNIMFNYLILKGYLQDEKDRQIPVSADERRQSLHPKYIREIIEELTTDYNLTDVEVRKILIEELTKEQLMQEEAEERLRLVEDQEQRRSEEQKHQEAMRRAKEERNRQKDEKFRELYAPELEYFREHLYERLSMRRKEAENSGLQNPQEDFADAALQLELEEQRRLEAQQEALRQKELVEYQKYFDEIDNFKIHLAALLEQRVWEERELRHAEELRQQARQERQAKKNTKGGFLKWKRG